MNLPDNLCLFDTPGIPLKNQISCFIDDPAHVYSTVCRHPIRPLNVPLRVGHSLWLGGIAKLDYFNGSDMLLSVCVPREVTIHPTNTNLSAELYDRQKGKLLLPVYNMEIGAKDFEMHEILEKCEVKDRASFDISIFGLGWVSVQGNGQFHCGLHLHKQVGYKIRSSLCPFEIEDKGIRKVRGRTINIAKSTKLMKMDKEGAT
jgi:ribosome biogenesis GTPase A